MIHEAKDRKWPSASRRVYSISARAGILALLAIGSTMAACAPGQVGDRDAVYDAWALLREYGPRCEESQEGQQSEKNETRLEAPLGIDDGGRFARRILGREILGLAAELVNDRGDESEAARLVIDFVAVSRQLCESVRLAGLPLGSPSTSFGSENAHERAPAVIELLALAARLDLLLPMSIEERDRRTSAYLEKLSEAVSDAIETVHEATGGKAWEGTPIGLDERMDEGAEELEEEVVSTLTENLDLGSQSGTAPKIVIRSTSGETWEEMRNRRAVEKAKRLAYWRPIFEREFAALIEARQALAKDLAGDSLAGAHELCERLGRVARALDPEAIKGSPDRVVRQALGIAVAGYSAAGEACAERRFSAAFLALDHADSAWKSLSRL